MTRIRFLTIALLWSLCCSGRLLAADPTVDLSGYRADSGVTVQHEDGRLRLSWPLERATRREDRGHLVLDLRPGRPLIQTMGISGEGFPMSPVLENLDPATYVLVGSRQAPAGRPPGMSVFNVFFDTPANRPFQAFLSKLDLKRVRVSSQGHRATVTIGDVTVGPFSGELQFTVHQFSRLLHVETVIHTQEDRRAILYDTGLAFSTPVKFVRFAWMDTEGKLHREQPAADTPDRHLAVRHRTLIAERFVGSIACFPPPHPFFFPRDLTDNQSTVWYGRGHRGLDDRFGFGIRQSERGGGSFVPWFNAPPGTDQRLGVFYLFSNHLGGEPALRDVLRYTNSDGFPKLPGYHTMTSHWHMAIAAAALKEQARGGPRSTPDFVAMFKKMGVEIVHLAEFHGDGHPRDPGPVRLAEMQAMFDECKRLSDSEILFLPGEEANTYLGSSRPGKETGHWMYLFPKPVYWTMTRSPAQPFVEDRLPFGPVYHVGDGADMLGLLEREGGLAWTAHARIKASSWTPDIFRRQDFYLSDRWLGAAWKAMPADLSDDRLGRRALDLLDDMANWGQKKYLPGEVDVFKLDHTHELFGHMNINYVRLDPDRLPRFTDGWQPVVDSLRSGRFFVTTGEVLIPEFLVDGQPSGSTVVLGKGGKAEVRVDLKWTFPLNYVELISGDGSRVYRDRIDCSDTAPFEGRTLRKSPDLTGRTWIRLEAWDVAGNGAFTQPVWLAPSRE
ncbi:MAG: hypothetical protein ACHRXM_22185 [Isosphaerales bacterium]